MILPTRNYPGPLAQDENSQFNPGGSSISFTYNIDSYHFYSYSPQAMPPKSKAQPSNPDRVT